ncbi:MAG: hypothetical protein Tsb009_23070 [Planctomycetaceae bacterium]
MSELRQPSQSSSRYGWIVSLAFWLALFVAVGLYGAVTLAPKMLKHEETRKSYLENQMGLVRLESRVEYLNRVADAMENDPHFSRELARMEFNASHSDGERIPVNYELTLAATKPESSESVQVSPSVYEPVLKLFANNERIRRWSLISAAVIVIVAFTFLHESQVVRLQKTAQGVVRITTGVGSGLGVFFDRYRKPPSSPEETP